MSDTNEERYVSRHERKVTDGSLTMDEVVAYLAKKILCFDTLETRKSDSLDFSEVAVWSVKEALELAYRAGQHSSK